MISILIAIALSEILASWGALIQHRPAVFSWLWLGASLLLTRFLIGHWLGLSAYRSIDTFSIGGSLLVFSPSLVAALAAFVLAPNRSGEEPLDLDAHYLRIAPWLFSLLAIFILLAGLSDLLIPGLEPLPLWLYVAWAALLLAPALTASRRVHAVAIVASLVVPVLYAALRGLDLRGG